MCNKEYILDICASSKCIRSRGADSQDRDERQALSRCWRSLYFIISGFMLLVLQPISSISQVSGARKHSPTSGWMGSGCKKEWAEMNREIEDMFVQFTLLIASSPLLSRPPIFSASSLKMTSDYPCTSYNSLHYKKRYLRWHFKTRIQIWGILGDEKLLHTGLLP